MLNRDKWIMNELLNKYTYISFEWVFTTWRYPKSVVMFSTCETLNQFVETFWSLPNRAQWSTNTTSTTLTPLFILPPSQNCWQVTPSSPARLHRGKKRRQKFSTPRANKCVASARVPCSLFPSLLLLLHPPPWEIVKLVYFYWYNNNTGSTVYIHQYVCIYIYIYIHFYLPFWFHKSKNEKYLQVDDALPVVFVSYFLSVFEQYLYYIHFLSFWAIFLYTFSK